MGCGKSTYVQSINDNNIKVLSRDDIGGCTKNMLYMVETTLKEISVIIDNTNLTIATRKQFIDIAKKLKIPVSCIYIKSTIETCQIRVLHRMYQKYNNIFMTGKLPNNQTDSHIFPPAALFLSRKQLQEPNDDEGFSDIKVIKDSGMVWDKKYKNYGLFLDIDGTLRETDDLPNKYPTEVSEVKLAFDKTNMQKVINSYVNKNYKLFGISNQSGIAKGTLTNDMAIKCFNKTKELLDCNVNNDFDILYCPHGPVPISCYCRKPQVGQAMLMIEKYKLDPKKCIMVGDRTTDKTMAQRLGMTFIYANVFFK